MLLKYPQTVEISTENSIPPEIVFINAPTLGDVSDMANWVGKFFEISTPQQTLGVDLDDFPDELWNDFSV